MLVLPQESPGLSVQGEGDLSELPLRFSFTWDPFRPEG